MSGNDMPDILSPLDHGSGAAMLLSRLNPALQSSLPSLDAFSRDPAPHPACVLPAAFFEQKARESAERLTAEGADPVDAMHRARAAYGLEAERNAPEPRMGREWRMAMREELAGRRIGRSGVPDAR